MQEERCGYKGFDLHCDDTLGTLIRLPRDVVLHVDEIDYESEVVILSDPYDRCLPQKLLALDLIDTPFRLANVSFFFSKKFWLYNCSVPNYHGYDRIDCLSGSNYTVISAKYDIIDVLPSNVCKFLKNLTVSTLYPSSSLNNISTIDLSWSGVREPPTPSDNSRHQPYTYYYSQPVGLILPITGTVTIDSYPVIVIGASGRLTNPDDTTCPICLSDYCPQETLKILPECNHQFHADCIDQWLRSKGVCPFCRANTPRTSSDH
ncbi:RING-H2 finger protein ATL22-like [Silene latifolia]|uniref:RING-H2 finger protein ATL22-like n=1 Tax=Silene latifolia TaxID=37657 RepID=UPI003D778943